MEAGGIQGKLHGILRRINSEELRLKVNEFQKIIASASSRFRGQNDDLSQTDGDAPLRLSPIDNMEGEVTNDSKLLSPVEEHPPRTKSPVQLWVDSLPVAEPSRREDDMPPITEVDVADVEVESFTLGAEAPGVTSPRPYPTFHVTNPCGGSDAGSHCSSMESLLEARKPDPEELLLELGFGGSEEPDVMSRIPTRFLQPSKLKGVSIDDFLKHQQHMVNTFQSGFNGYRGLTGPSHAIPSGIVGKIMDRLREAEVERQHQIQQQQHQQQYQQQQQYHQQQQYQQQQYQQQQCQQQQFVAQPAGYSPKLARLAQNVINKIKCVKEVSVLSPENRNWYESQGDKSPEPSNRRMIIGQQSFIFSKDGSLIESSNNTEKTESSSDCASRTESAQDNFNGSETDEKLDKEGTNFNEQPTNFNNFDNEPLQTEYKSLSNLLSEISGSEYPIDIGSEEEFHILAPEKRKQLQIGVIKAALNTYQERLRELDLRSHFKDLLNGQVHKVTDLLDAHSSPSVVTIIKEMTCLLRHQESLKQALNLHEENVCFNETIS